MEAGHFHLDNIIAVIDTNRLQIDGWVKDVMEVQPLDEKYAAFGWRFLHVDGHDMNQLVAAFAKARAVVGKPVSFSPTPFKGKGVSFMENVAGWHGKTPNREELNASLKELGLDRAHSVEMLLNKAKSYQTEIDRELEAKMPKFSRDFWWNSGDAMRSRWSLPAKASASRLRKTATMSASFASDWTSPAP